MIGPGGTIWDKIVELCGLTRGKMIGPGGTKWDSMIGPQRVNESRLCSPLKFTEYDDKII